MPRTLPTELESAMDSGEFTSYFAIGKRNYDATPPTTLTGYTTLIESEAITYYKYNGKELTIKYYSENLPETDGLIVGDLYYIERGIIDNEIPYTIKSASLRFDNYTITRKIITANLSLFSSDQKTASMAGDDTYSTILSAYNPLTYWLGTTTLKTTPENINHWEYKFFATGKNLNLSNNKSFLSLIKQKYLITAYDNSDDLVENGIEYTHLSTPINGRYWYEQGTTLATSIIWVEQLQSFFGVSSGTSLHYSTDGFTWNSAIRLANKSWTNLCYAPELSLIVAIAADTGTSSISTSPDGITWTTRTSPASTNGWAYVCWSPELSLFAAVGGNGNQVMTSPDGITWTLRTGAMSSNGLNILWAAELALFIAIGNGVTNAMSSQDGITWNGYSLPAQATSKESLSYSPDLQMLVYAPQTVNTIYTSTTGLSGSWTARTVPGSQRWSGLCWSANLSSFFAVANNANAGGTDQIAKSTDGITWENESVETERSWTGIVWSPYLYRFVIWATTYQTESTREAIDIDHTITRDDITIESDALSRQFVWRDEAQSIHIAGTGVVHNLGYLESTDLPPAAYTNADKGSIEVGIHLKYLSGDLFKLQISETQYASYYAEVTEILDTKNAIGWRNEIKILERFANTDGGPLPSTIERVAAYTPLVTESFDGNLDATVNNLQALAEAVDNLPISASSSYIDNKPTTNTTIPAGKSIYIPDYFEVINTYLVTIEDTAIMEIG